MRHLRILAAVLLVHAVTLAIYAQPPTSSTQGDLVGGRTLADWIKDLSDPDASVRDAAILAIPRFGPAAEQAVPKLMEICLNDKDAGPRCQAVITLPKIKIAEKDVHRVIETLGKCLNDNQGVIRYQAVLGLVAAGEKSRGALKDLLRAAQQPQPTWQIKEKILIALQSAGREKNKSPDIEVIKVFLDSMQRSTSAQVRLQAAIGLGALGPPVETGVLLEEEKALLAKANDRYEREAGVKIWANASLMALDKVDEHLLKRIGEFLKSPRVETRVQAAHALGVVGEKAKAAVPKLKEMLDDKEKPAAAAAIDALLQIDADGSRRAVLDHLKNPGTDPEVRAYAASAVGAYGEKIKDALPMLVDLVNDKEERVVQAACLALAQMGNVDPRGRKAIEDLRDRKDTPEKMKKFAEECVKLMDRPPEKFGSGR
jgi:HEAT repeat protein